MKKIDVSVILNVHKEGLILKPTLNSLEVCAGEANHAGLLIELIVVFDCSDELTKRVFQKTTLRNFAQIKKIEVDFRSLGLARNAGIDLAEGDYIWTSDGDDLVSKNSLVELIRIARQFPDQKTVFFLEFLVSFGEYLHIARYHDSNHFTPADFAFFHPYVSRVFLKRQFFEGLRYKDLRLRSHFSYEDWDFNNSLYAEGFKFMVAPGSILFYRIRAQSLLRKTNSISCKLTPHSKLFEPKVFLELMGKTHKNRELRKKILLHNNVREAFFEMKEAKTYLEEAAKLEPEIEPKKIEHASSYNNIAPENHWGFDLEKLYRLVGPEESFSDVLLLPWLNPGGAEKYILQILEELHRSGKASKILVVSGEPCAKHLWVKLLPPGSIFLDLYNGFPWLNQESQHAMLARALLALTPQKARLHIKQSPFAYDFIESYGSILKEHFLMIFYRFCNNYEFFNGTKKIDVWSSKNIRLLMPLVHRLICDCQSIKDEDIYTFGTSPERYQVIYAKCQSNILLEKRKNPSKKILWASRISIQKRPELLIPLACQLRKHFPGLVLVVYGALEQPYNAPNLFDDQVIEYRGPFDGFESLPLDEFDAFLYTSHFDGMPNIVLEAMTSGLPVIAPDVGGISESIINAKTGYLIPDHEDETLTIKSYVDAIDRLYKNWSQRDSIIKEAQKLIEDRHSQKAFAKSVADCFDSLKKTKEWDGK